MTGLCGSGKTVGYIEFEVVQTGALAHLGHQVHNEHYAHCHMPAGCSQLQSSSSDNHKQLLQWHAGMRAAQAACKVALWPRLYSLCTVPPQYKMMGWDNRPLVTDLYTNCSEAFTARR